MSLPLLQLQLGMRNAERRQTDDDGKPIGGCAAMLLSSRVAGTGGCDCVCGGGCCHLVSCRPCLSGLSGGLDRHHSLTSPVVSLQLVTLDVADGLRPLSFGVSVGALVVSW